MELKICSLSSSSSGNCVYVASERTKILIDAGVPLNRIGKSLKVLSQSCDNLSVLVTHSHSDHIGGLPKVKAEYGAKVFSHYLSCATEKKLQRLGAVEVGEIPFFIGDIEVTPFRVSHDVPTVGYSLRCGGSKISILTDLGVTDCAMLDFIKDSGLVFIEANHDEELVNNNDKYPYFLKRRILSAKGHLSNTACADAVAHLANGGVKQFVLGHLSKENNYPELAFRTVAERLALEGIVEGRDVGIEIAPHDAMSGLYTVASREKSFASEYMNLVAIR